MKYTVARTFTKAEYCDVEASSEQEAVRKAKELPEECWETNPNDQIIEYEDYIAELDDNT